MQGSQLNAADILKLIATPTNSTKHTTNFLHHDKTTFGLKSVKGYDAMTIDILVTY